jgi:hypothetical protein
MEKQTMSAAFRTAAPLAALAAASILAGCTVEPAPYTGTVYATGPSAVFVEPYYRFGYYHYGYYGHPYGPGFHDGGFHGGGMHGRG